MTKSTQPKRKRKTSSGNGWPKPYPDFPLSYHPPSKRLYKKILGHRYYFGYASDWRAAIKKYENEREARYAGRTPRVDPDGLTVRGLCNHLLTSKKHLLDANELSPRTFDDHYVMADMLIAAFGRNRLVADLASSDFDSLRASFAKTRGPVALGACVQRVRVFFNYAYEAKLIDKPISYGSSFKRPPKRVLRQARNDKAPKMFEANEIHILLEEASVQVRAMILLGVNCGYGNSDVASLSQANTDLDGGWVDFPRTKSAIQRRCKLWPETVEAIREAIDACPQAKDKADDDLIFITSHGNRWVRTKQNSKNHGRITSFDEVTQAIIKIIGSRKLNTVRNKGRGFYALRHTFETIGGGTTDQVAVNAIMGHVDNSMAAVYRERIDDDRLEAVAEHVWTWLYSEEK